jgi:hypothetical protein
MAILREPFVADSPANRLKRHASMQTARSYLGSGQEIAVAVNNNLGL